MDYKVQEEWARKLTDGTYQQGHQALRTGAPGEESRFCCLGVLCDIVDPNGWSWDPDGKKWRFQFFNGQTVEKEGDFLPRGLVEKLGLKESNPTVKVPGKSLAPDNMTLASLNDDGGYSFIDIAEKVWQL